MPLPPDSEHFPATPPYNYSYPLIQLGDLINNGFYDRATQFMIANKDMIAATLGNINAARAAYKPSVTPVPYAWGDTEREPFDLPVGKIQCFTTTVPANAPAGAIGTFNAGCEDAYKRTLYFALATEPGVFEGPSVIALAGGQIASIIFGIKSGTQYVVQPGQVLYLNIKDYDAIGGPAWIETTWPK